MVVSARVTMLQLLGCCIVFMHVHVSRSQVGREAEGIESCKFHHIGGESWGVGWFDVRDSQSDENNASSSD